MTGGFGAALAAYLTAAATLVALILSAAAVVARGEQTTMGGLRSAAPTVKRFGGWILVVVGVWFLLLTIFTRAFSDLFPV